MKTLDKILRDANSVLDLENASPSGDELLTRSNYADQAIWDASALAQLKEFKREFLTTASTLATISLPTDFREMQENPQLWESGGWTEYPVIEVEQKYQYSTSDKYCYVLGNPRDGYKAIFNGITPSNNLSIVYQRYPSGMLTLTDVCELSDPQYVVRAIESYVLYSRSDDRFQIAKEREEQQLSNMLGRGMKGSVPGGKSTKMTFTNPLKNLS